MSKWIVAVEWDKYESTIYEFDTYLDAKEKFDSYNSDTEIDKMYIAQVREGKGKRFRSEVIT